MEKKNTHHEAGHSQRVSSMYAAIYFDGDYCDVQTPVKIKTESKESFTGEKDKESWASPSDLLIGKIDLKPPFTSKITRGKTHEGILAIGNDVLENERAKFLKHLTDMISDNDNGWAHILENERKLVQHKVRHIYNKIFDSKSKIMSKEISKFYEKTLQELEDHLRSEINTVLSSAHANVISDSNIEIKQRLAKERSVLEDELKRRYESEVSKIKKYYKLLSDNELERNNKLVNQALYERNEALTAFYRQIEAENVTSTMYVMCTERKKCKVRQFILENYQSSELTETMRKIKDRQNILDNFKKQEVHLTQINKDWEEKTRKVLKLFIKFISFSLKLLPEQATFLLDLERMIILQMNEIQKYPEKRSSILVEEELFKNLFKFEEPEPKVTICKEKPFFIVGDFNDPTPPRYGSRETLPSDVDLPYIRVERHFVYAKCHKFEQIKDLLEKQKCQCQDMPTRSLPDFSALSGVPASAPPSPSPTESISSDEPLLIDDIKRLHHCPARSCQNWVEKSSFPYLNSYLDFTDEKFERVKTILGTPVKKTPPPDLIDPKKYVMAELPFSATNEPYHTIETQYSSQEELNLPEVGCTCIDIMPVKKTGPKFESWTDKKESTSKELNTFLERRKVSLRNIMQENPNLLKMFTDECFDFQL